MGVNNLPKVVTQHCLEQDLNPRPTDRKPKCLTVAPPRHLLTDSAITHSHIQAFFSGVTLDRPRLNGESLETTGVGSYRPAALPVNLLTVSKHRTELKAMSQQDDQSPDHIKFPDFSTGDSNIN